MAVFIAALVAAAIIAIFIGIRRYALQAQELEERFEEAVVRVPVASGQAKEKRRLRERLDEWLSAVGFATRTRAELARANIKLTVAEFMLARLGLTILAFLAGWGISHQPLGGILLAILASFLPGWYVRRQQVKRLQAFQEQLPDVLSLLVSSLRAGHGLLQALNLVVQEMPEPTREEFGRVVREVTLGFPTREALAHLVRRVNSDDLELVVTAINIQHEVGGNLAEILDTISKTIRERVRLMGEIRVMTSQQRLTGTVLTGLPFLLGTGLMLINPDYMMGMFQPGWPILIPITAVVMMVIGYFLMQRVLRMDV